MSFSKASSLQRKVQNDFKIFRRMVGGSGKVSKLARAVLGNRSGKILRFKLINSILNSIKILANLSIIGIFYSLNSTVLL